MNQCLKDLNVLYAEDDSQTLKLTAMLLEDYVKNLFVAKNGHEAWRLFRKHKIDIVITDVLMPKISGLELTHLIRASEQPNTPIVITSAHTEVKYLLEAIEQKVDGYVVKPINLDSLLKSMQKAILPFLQAQEIKAQNLLIDTISTFVGGKKIEIIRFLIEHSDENNIFYGSYEDILHELNVSKPTIVKTFKQLLDTGILIKIKNKVYQFHPDFVPSKS